MSGNALVDVLTSPTPEKLDAYQKLVGEMPQYDLQTMHLPHAKMYARSVYIGAGVTFVGAVWEKDHICILAGDVTVTTDEGSKRFTGYHVFPVKAGSRRAGYAHCDTCWTTVVHTDETDITKIEDECTLDGDKLQSRKLLIASKESFLLEEK